MALVNFTGLDFDQLKISIRDYLRSNSNFTDYDFEGSNLSVLVDVLAYNTYISSYNANMVSNEVFIDSATLRENVVSLARNIGYVPRSRKAAKANISLFVDTTEFSTTPLTMTLKRGVVCSTGNVFGNVSYAFTISEDKTVPVVNNIALFDNVDIVEGNFVVTNFVKDPYNKKQRFILPNTGIDTSTIKVTVKSNQYSTSRTVYTLAENLFNVTANSNIYLIQEIEDGQYELIFGDGVFGRQLSDGNVIEVSYNVCNGENGNNISSFSFAGRITYLNGSTEVVVTSGISLVTTNTPSFGGAAIQSVDAIRKYAPKYFSTKNRAVTASDYESLVSLVYPEAKSISVFGGEELSPPKYGKVFISIKPTNGNYLSNTIKENIQRDLRKYSVAGIVTEIIDLKYLFIEVNSKVYYNTNQSQSSSQLKTTVSSNIENYSKSSELNGFGSRFKYSKFLKLIDDSDQAITSNITTIVIRRDLSVNLNAFTKYEICYGNRFNIKNMSGYNIKSSGFKIAGLSDTLYLGDLPDTNGLKGRVFLFKLSATNSPIIVRNNVGTVDYIKGEILLNPINISSTTLQKDGSPTIEISAVPYSNDVIGLQDLYLSLDINNTNVEIIPDKILSGTNPSGKDYIVSSSYSNGLLVR
jgi:hypothetical protein